MSKYYYPNEEDLQSLLDKMGPNFDTGKPFLEGWGRLTTLYVSDFETLTRPQKDFITKKIFEALDQVELLSKNDQEQKGSWLIENESALLAHENDWREALPALEEGKEYLFLDPPASHYEYKEEYFAYNVFETPEEIQKSTELLPYGESCGTDI